MCAPSFKPGVFYVFVHICALWIRRRPVDSLNPTQSELDIEIKKEKRGGKKKHAGTKPGLRQGVSHFHGQTIKSWDILGGEKVFL